jgi:hypothetical protein
MAEDRTRFGVAEADMGGCRSYRYKKVGEKKGVDWQMAKSQGRRRRRMAKKPLKYLREENEKKRQKMLALH